MYSEIKFQKFFLGFEVYVGILKNRFFFIGYYYGIGQEGLGFINSLVLVSGYRKKS